MRTRWAAVLSGVWLVATGRADGEETGFYAGLDVGAVEATPAANEILFSGLINGGLVSPVWTSSDGSHGGWSGFLGYRINRHLAGEFTYTDYGLIGVQAAYDVSHLGNPFFPGIFLDSSTSEISGPSISLRGILPIADIFEAFARVGLLFADREVRHVRTNFVSTTAAELWLVGIGIDVELASRWQVRFEYQSVDRFPGDNFFAGALGMERYGFGVIYDF